jgi:hypothetical protein
LRKLLAQSYRPFSRFLLACCNYHIVSVYLAHNNRGSEMNISDIRRINLRNLIDMHGASALAVKLGYRQSSFLSQMAGPSPTRTVTDKTARAFEKQLGLAEGSLDVAPVEVSAPTEPVTQVAQPQPSAQELLTLALSATRTLGTVCETESVNLPAAKFADALALVLSDAFEHGAVRDSYTKQIVCLLK